MGKKDDDHPRSVEAARSLRTTLSPRRARRRLLSAAAGMAAALVGCGREGPDVQARDVSGRTSRAASAPPDANPDTSRRSRVVVVRDTRALDAEGRVNGEVVAAMLETAMRKVSGADSPADAWRTYVEPRDIVAIKVNCLGGASLCTHPALVDHIVDGMRRAGVEADRIIIYDRLTSELQECGFSIRMRGVRSGRAGPQCYGTDAVGYDTEPTVVMSTGSCFSRIISQQCSAIVNAPILKDHDGAGITCALKNHFGSINNPNKLHTDHCDPHIADINCAPVLRNKQRITVCDALMVCYDGGPAYKPRTTAPYGAILVSTDPVALDAMGLRIIEDLRKEKGLEPISSQERAPTYIATAADADHRLGTDRLENIELVEASVTV